MSAFEWSARARSTPPVMVIAALSAVVPVLVSSAAAGASPTSRACPTAALVNQVLGQKGKSPVATKTAYSKTCTYPGGGVVPTKITFQIDTASTFAAGEKAASALGIVVVHGLGKAAWGTKSGGSLFVFDGRETVKIVSPLTAIGKLETLARKLL